MNTLAQMLQNSFDWETLLPVLFFVLYGIAQLIGAMRKKNQKGEEEEPEVDMAERARQVREEIRRKIAERRQASEGGGNQSSRPYQYDPSQPDGQKPVFHPAPRKESPAPARRESQQPRRTETRRKGTSYADSQLSSLEKRLQKQREILEQSRRKQREALEKTWRVVDKSAGVRDVMAGEVGVDEIGSDGPSIRKDPEVIRNQRIRQNILSDLSHPDGLKKAVLYREIIGPPLGLR